jgi:hypothetical protein
MLARGRSDESFVDSAARDAEAGDLGSKRKRLVFTHERGRPVRGARARSAAGVSIAALPGSGVPRGSIDAAR